jgi:hypothetical protein
MPRRCVRCAFGLCPRFGLGPVSRDIGIHCTRLMTDTSPMREQERERAELEPGAQPRCIGHTTAGRSHRRTSGGEAVIPKRLCPMTQTCSMHLDESSMLLP